MKYLNKSLCLVFAILTSLFLFSCASPASGIGGDGGDVSVNQVPVGGSPFMGGGAGGGVAPGSTPQAAGAMPPAGSLTFKSSNSSSNSNGFYSEGLSSLGWTSLELDITANGITTHHSINPGNSIEFKNLAPGSTVSVTGTAVLPDGSTRNVKSDTYTVKKGENKLKLYCEYKYWRNGCYDTSCNGGPHTYMSNQSITLPVASDYTSGTNTYPFAGWIVYAPGLSTHGNYYKKGTNVPAGQVTGDVEFFADYGFALYKEGSAGAKAYIDTSTPITVAKNGLVELKADYYIDASQNAIPASITQITVTSGGSNAAIVGDKIKGVNVGTATVTYTGTTKYGAPFSVNVPVEVKPMSLQVKKSGSVITSYTQTKGDATQLTAEIVSDTPLPSGTIVNWTFDIPADTTIGFAANQYTTNTTTGSVSYTPSTSTLSYVLGMYKKADGTNLLGSLLPDTYSGTITVTAEFILDGVPQSLSTDLVVTGYTLPTFKAVIDTSNVSDLALKAGTTSTYIQDSSGTPKVAFKAEASSAGVVLPSGADAVYTWTFDPAIKVTSPTGISTGALPLESSFGIGKYSDTSITATCNLSYHGKTKSSTAGSMTINGDDPDIKLVVTAGEGTAVVANGTTTYDITQTAENGAFTINVTKEDGSALPIVSGVTIGFDNTNDYGISTKPDDNTSTFLLGGLKYNIKDDFGLGVGDSATITLSATYKNSLKGITKTFVYTLNIKGCGASGAAPGMYAYSDGTVSSHRNSGKSCGVIISMSGTTATVIRRQSINYQKLSNSETEIGVNTFNMDGKTATDALLAKIGSNINDYPVFRHISENRASEGIDWYLPSRTELYDLYNSTDKDTINAALPNILSDKIWTSTVNLENGTQNDYFKFVNFDTGGVAADIQTSTGKMTRLFAKINLTP